MVNKYENHNHRPRLHYDKFFALWKFCSLQHFVFATFFASETIKIFRITRNVNWRHSNWSCWQNKMNQRRTTVKEQRILSPDKKLWAPKTSRRHLWSLVTFEKIWTGEKGVHARNGLLLSDFFCKTNKTNRAIVKSSTRPWRCIIQYSPRPENTA